MTSDREPLHPLLQRIQDAAWEFRNTFMFAFRTGKRPDALVLVGAKVYEQALMHSCQVEPGSAWGRRGYSVLEVTLFGWPVVLVCDHENVIGEWGWQLAVTGGFPIPLVIPGDPRPPVKTDLT